MFEIKWIKITTDIFDDEKILLIESMPDADAIIVIWFKLLCLAGKQNNNGVFVMNDRIAYTDKMLATIFRRKESTVALALETFEQFGMIEVVDGVITIPNWGKHQNLDAIEKKTAYMKDYMREYRQKQKLLAGAAKETECGEGEALRKHLCKTNVSRTDKEEDKEIEEDNISSCAVSKIATTPKVISLPLSDKTEFDVFEDDVAKWRELYPAIDVLQELRNMCGWLDANPKNRKTRSGVKRFINGWLSKEQNRAKVSREGENGSGFAGHNRKSNTDGDYKDYDFKSIV